MVDRRGWGMRIERKKGRGCEVKSTFKLVRRRIIILLFWQEQEQDWP